MPTDLLATPTPDAAAQPPDAQPPADAERLLTAEEYRTHPGLPARSELIRGKVVEMSLPGWRHAGVGARISFLMQSYLENRRIGRSFAEAGVQTERGPDTVRGPDLFFCSYERLPAEENPAGYADVAPEVVFEILSPGNRQAEILRKVAEYFEAGVLCAVVVNPARRTTVLYHPDDEPTFLREEDRLALPAPLDGWTPSVAELLSGGN